MRFGDDWPGVFLRGDDALPLASSIENILTAIVNLPGMHTEKLTLNRFIKVLSSCDARSNPKAQNAMLVD